MFLTNNYTSEMEQIHPTIINMYLIDSYKQNGKNNDIQSPDMLISLI